LEGIWAWDHNILVAIVLLASALWEAFEVIYIVAPIAGGW